MRVYLNYDETSPIEGQTPLQDNMAAVVQSQSPLSLYLHRKL